MNLHIPSSELKPPPNWDRSGLPSWTYSNEELFELEAEELFRKHWQIACHTSDIDECANVKFLDRIELAIGKGHDNRPEDDEEHARLHEQQE